MARMNYDRPPARSPGWSIDRAMQPRPRKRAKHRHYWSDWHATLDGREVRMCRGIRCRALQHRDGTRDPQAIERTKAAAMAWALDQKQKRA